MHITTLKVTIISLLTLAFTAGSAFAGDGKDCKNKKHVTAKTEATAAQQTSVLPATTKQDAMAKKDMKAKKVYSFDEALALCQKKEVADLQACIDYKTGKTQPKS